MTIIVVCGSIRRQKVCKISKKMKMDFRVLVGILVFTPFAVAGNILRLAEEPIGGLMFVMVGIVMAIYIARTK